ncbi:MAG: peptide deformylase [Acidimicrobiaceae bacterium]|jgi:peptide deformylase|nr:peptide deformylase [Acidimicrobiaceae bacterium]MBD32538.1 peptide deformylase [Acidimicrobiaceae bacterium]MCH2627835.1 peptide deformylase [Acidimicrobiales bacterium]MEC9113244.1 peptide deformylase [Actinomycetota bacterium]|tara:strand:+ start:1029 stop:1556 length:528 start_codon:yes stop_codon:yes gene_type:complete
MSYQIRLMGDPVLRQTAASIEDIDGRIAKMVEDMVPAMYQAEGIGLAAPQVGIQKRLFVYDIGEGPETLVNPEIVDSDGEWSFQEGCLSVPGLSFEIIRPKEVHLVGRDLEGNEVSIEADELLARLFQHELDHLDGVLLLDHLERDERKAALRQWRNIQSSQHSDFTTRADIALP